MTKICLLDHTVVSLLLAGKFHKYKAYETEHICFRTVANVYLFRQAEIRYRPTRKAIEHDVDQQGAVSQ